MFFWIVGVLLIFVFLGLWGDYIKLLIWLEVFSLIFLLVVVKIVSVGYFSLWYFLICLVFLVCESRLGFLLYVIYIRMDYEVVKKLGLVQC